MLWAGGPADTFRYGFGAFDERKRVLDIGGVHTSVGEYADLWDYIEKGDTEPHRLEMFYMERGASGSTCWMQFTIPDADFEIVDRDTKGSLCVEKAVVNPEYSKYPSYKFDVEFVDTDMNPLAADIRGTVHSADGSTSDCLVANGKASFLLAGGDRMVFDGLPVGTKFTVTEDEYGCATSVSLDGGDPVEGASAVGIIQAGSTSDVSYSNEFMLPFEMPRTGGTGAEPYIAAGSAMALLAGLVLIRRRRRG